MRKRQKTRGERELAATLAEVSEKETARQARRSRRSKKTQPAAPELVDRPLFMSASLPAPPIPPLPTTLQPAPGLVSTLAKKRLDDFDANSIQNYQELIAALRAKKVQITLGNDIIATDNILINYDVALNFNGHSIISDETIPAARVLDIRSGEVTLTGKGKIFAMGDHSVALRVFGAISTEMPSYTSVTIDEGISLFSPTSAAIYIAPNLGVAYGLKLNFSGEIIAHDGICLSADVRGQATHNLPIITLKSGARIIADENSGAALSALGYGIWNIGAVCLRGASGLRAQSGQIKFSHTQMVSNGPSQLATFQIEPSAEANLELAIDGGTYTSEHSYIIAGTAASLQKLSIKDADFHGALGDYPSDIQSVLIASAQPAPEPVPAAPVIPAPAPAVVAPEEPVDAELIAARDALTDALSDLDKLRSADYIAGFSAFRQALTQAKKVLRQNSDLADIRDAASALLDAFDQLEERDDTSLTDEELDELFYHGAVLEEITAEPEKPAKKPRLFGKKPFVVTLPVTPEPTTTAPEPVPATPATPVTPVTPAPASTAPTEPVTPATSIIPTATAAPVAPVVPEPNLSMLSEVISAIGRLDPQKYTAASYQTLLSTLTNAKSIIGRDVVRQSEVDQIASLLLTQLTDLEPAPALQPFSAFSSGAIDEMSPSSQWSAGVSAIDETTPFDYANSQLPRVKAPKLSGFFKSISAGVSAGFVTYRRSRRNTRTTA